MDTDYEFDFQFLGAGMFSGGAAESTEETAQSLQGQKVRRNPEVMLTIM